MKKALAIILSAVLIISMFSTSAFAAAANPSITKSGDTGVTVTWTAISGASYYTVQLLRDNAAYGSAQRVLATATLSYSASNLSGGTYTAVVSTYNAGGILLDTSTTSASVVIPISGAAGGNTTSSSNITLTNGVLSWQSAGVGVYYYVYYYVNGQRYAVTSAPITETYINVSNIIRNYGVYGNNLYFQVYLSSNTSIPYATYYYNAYGNGSASGSGVNLSANGILSWTSAGEGVSYYVFYSLNGQMYSLTVNPIPYNYLNVSEVISKLAYGQSVTFTIYTYSNPNVPYATFTYSNGGGTASGGNGIYVTVASTTALNVSWDTSANTGVTHYLVTVAITNSVSVSFRYGYENTVTVQACSGSQILYTVGTATVSPTGQVTYTPGAGTGTGTGNTVYGVNCTLTINSAYNSTVNWTATDPGPFVVIVSPANGSPQQTFYSSYNYCTIPYGSSTSFSVSVLSNSTTQVIASVSYAASSSSPGTTTGSGIASVTLGTDSSAAVAWNAYPGAKSYRVSAICDGEVVDSENNLAVLNAKVTYAPGKLNYIVVHACAENGVLGVVGFATVDPDGNVQSAGAWYGGYVPNANGTGCELTVSGPWTSLLTFTASGFGNYTVKITSGSDICQYTVQSGSCVLPHGFTTKFEVKVYSGTAEIASVSYPPQGSSIPHEHSFTEYGAVSEVHWQICSVCGFTQNVEAHTVKDGKCEVCGHKASSERHYDVDNNGKVNSLDAVLILRFLAGLEK